MKILDNTAIDDVRADEIRQDKQLYVNGDSISYKIRDMVRHMPNLWQASKYLGIINPY